MNASLLTVIVAGLCGALGGAALLGIWHAIRGYERAVKRLAEEQVKQQTVIDQLQLDVKEVVKGKKHTYRTSAGLEDATAVAIDLAGHVKAEMARLRQLEEILTTLRVGPQAYDPDRPAGLRPDGWDGNGRG